MSTISSKEVILEMLRNGGRFQDDPPPRSIYEYYHPMSDQILYAVFWDGMPNDIASSPYIESPELLFFNGELTKAGRRFLSDNRK